MQSLPLSQVSNSNKISAVVNIQPAISMMECRIPFSTIDKLNNYIDKTRDVAESHASSLVGQINQRQESSQLSINQEDEVPKAFIKTLEKLASSYITTMGYKRHNINCDDIWTVHSYAGDYNPLHNHRVKTKIGLSCILYLKLSDEMIKNKQQNNVSFENASGMADGYTFFNWGTAGTTDIDMMKYNTETYIKPEVGKLLLFPHWLKHSVNPFFGEGERRTLAANFNVETNEKITQHIYQIKL